MRARYLSGSEEERFWPKVVKMEGACWIWVAALNGQGYGIFRRADGANVRAHRWAYEHLVGPIPPGMEIDHSCSHRCCVNPDHLEAVTHQENVSRALPGRRSDRRLWTHCVHGHEYTDANTAMVQGRRRCKACRNERDRRKRRESR